METKVCYTALFGDYEELRDPDIVPDGWKFVCFTDQLVKSDVWEIVPAEVIDTPQRTARWYKIKGWIYWRYSMWIDCSFHIKTDIGKWWNERFKSPFSCASHPLRTDIYAESRSCMVNGRGDDGKVLKQEQRYKEMAFPQYQGIITSGILMRENTPENIKLHQAWWKELSEQSVRDQLSFAYVSLGIDWVNTYKWDYSQSKEFVYHKHKHLRR